MTMMQISFC